MYRPTKYPSLDKDPRLENVSEKLSALLSVIDDEEWAGNIVSPNIVNEARRLRNLVSEGRVWEPKF